MSEEYCCQKQFDQKREAEIDSLLCKLEDILDKLQPRYCVPFQTSKEKLISLDDVEKGSRKINRKWIPRPNTSLTFKIIYMLSVVIFGFFLNWLLLTPPIYVTGLITSVSLALFPVTYIIYLRKLTESFCDTSEQIEYYISKRVFFNEDVTEMKELIKYGTKQLFKSIWYHYLNYSIVYTVLYKSMSIGLIPQSRTSSETIQLINDPGLIIIFCVFVVFSPIFIIFTLRRRFVPEIIKSPSCPDIIRLFF